MGKDQVKTIKDLLEKLETHQLAEVRRIIDQLLRQASTTPPGDGHPDPLERVIGTCPGPKNLAEEHDRYIYDESQ